MPTSARLTVLLLLTTVAACDEPAELIDSGDSPRSAALTNEVCDPSNQVALFSEPVPCAQLGGSNWSGARLFTGTDVPVGLRAYCRFDGEGSANPDTLVASLDSAVALAEAELGRAVTYKVAADCEAVSTQGTAVAAAVPDEFDAYFGWLAGRITAHDVAAEVGAPVALVHTAVVDTYPSYPAAPVDPKSTHGPVVSSIIESFVCPSGVGCAQRVRSYLGLPRTPNGLNVAQGGMLGRQSDLARGIYSAVQAHADSGLNADHLLINLSVAWEAERFGGGNLDMEPAAMAVYDAIRVARCEGALIIAAAGNESELSCTGEPMAPARWEEFAAPTKPECEELGVVDPYVDPAADAPLVHAVGGLFSPTVPMATSRASGMPRLAAASSHAMVHPRTGLAEPVVRTGTSIGAAVVSGAASLIWAYRPELSPSELVELIYAAGSAVPMDAQFGMGTGDPVHRVDACAAVDAALPGASFSCEAEPPSLDDIASGAMAEAAGPPELLTTGAGLACETTCGAPYMFYPAAGSTQGCEDTQVDPWRWLIAPQPTQAGCPDCILTTDNPTDQTSVLLSISDEFAGYTIEGARLEVYDSTGDMRMVGLTERQIQSGAIQPRHGEVRNYDVSLALGGIVPVRAYVMMAFSDDATDASYTTRDALVVHTID